MMYQNEPITLICPSAVNWTLRLPVFLLSVVICHCGALSIVPQRWQHYNSALFSHRKRRLPTSLSRIIDNQQQQRLRNNRDISTLSDTAEKIKSESFDPQSPISTDEYRRTAESTLRRRLLLLTSFHAISSFISPLPPLLSASDLPWEASPVNKRSGKTVFDAEEQGYNVRFVTYLSRFLLNFDKDCQRWWFSRAGDIPRNAKIEKVADMRLRQFGAFSASVEVGLQEYVGSDGPQRLMQALLDRYTADASKDITLQLSPNEERKQQREVNEARRQIALLFGLMEKNQPVTQITKTLAAVDNATITEVVIESPGSGYAPGYGPPAVTFPLPEAGELYRTAKGRAVLKPSGRLLRINISNRGFGYLKPPEVIISPPLGAQRTTAVNETKYEAATATAIIFRNGVNKGRIERIQLENPGKGYTEEEKIRIQISAPELSPVNGGVIAVAAPVLEYEVGSIIIIDGGYGYAAEKAIPVIVDPPPLTARIDLNDPVVAQYFLKKQTLSKNPIPMELVASSPEVERAEKAARGSGSGGGGGCIGRECYDLKVVAFAYAVSEADSYSNFRDSDVSDKVTTVEAALERRSASVVSGSSTGYDGGSKSFPFKVGESSSSLLALIPSGIGLTYISRLQRYILAPDEDYDGNFGEGIASTKPLDPEFGPRGRSPIERERDLDILTYLRFCASGAICSGGVHLALTPLDVVKTKLQTNPLEYPDTITAFKKVWSEGPSTFFTGWQPTFVGFFAWGSISYSTTEVFRRYFTSLVGVDASNLEVPIIIASAALASGIGSCLIVPFETVRIRSVSQPTFANNIIGVARRIIEEEGASSLFSALPAFLFKEIPFACAKFTVFDLSTQYMYQLFPAAQEDLRLSLYVSLVGGALGGIMAALVSNPADATVSEMKKAKTSLGPTDAAKALLARGGIPALFSGLPLRMFFYSVMISLQFFVYDSVRFALGIGSDDLKLYLDVLGGALKESGGPV